MMDGLLETFLKQVLTKESVGTSGLSTRELDRFWNDFNHSEYRNDNKIDSFDDGPDLTLDDKLADIGHQVYQLVTSKGGKIFGAGGSRQTFILTSKLILKLAVNEKGLEQNKTEYEISQKFPNITAKVYKTGPEYYYIVSELVRPITNWDEFENLTKINWVVFRDIMSALAKTNSESLSTVVLSQKTLSQLTFLTAYQVKKFFKEPLVVSLFEVVKKGGLSIVDLQRVEHYGKTADGRIVLLDYGLSHDTWKKLYNR